MFSHDLRLVLSPEDQYWFQGGWQSYQGESTLYNEAFSPSEVAHGKHIWGGLMLPDSLPLLGNGMGDCLCMRFQGDGSVLELVEWHHEGSDWTHCGYSIQEALSANRVNFDASAVYSAPLSPVVVAETNCKRALQSRLHEVCAATGGRNLSRLAGVEWALFRTWLFDPSLIPEDKLKALSESLEIKAGELISQNWTLAAEQAESVLKLRDDLAWPYAVVGWANERNGRISAAKDAYRAGLMKLGSSSSFTSNWTRINSLLEGKFAAERLTALADSGLDSQAREYLDALKNRAVRRYWTGQAQRATERREYSRAYQDLYAAGWDQVYFNDIGEVLSLLTDAAAKAGFNTLAELASLHRRSLQAG